MVRRDEANQLRLASRCSTPAGASPASVSTGTPSSRPPTREGTRVGEARCQEPLRREPVRGPQHQVKPAASSESQSERRAGHVAAKTTSGAPQSGDARAPELGGVWGAARGHGAERNTRGPSARPGSGQRGSYKPTAKSSRAQRESEGTVVLMTTATNNAARGKGPCFGRAWDEGTCQGMAGRTGPNYPDPLAWVVHVNAQQLLPKLGTQAERGRVLTPWLRRDVRSAVHAVRTGRAHASPRRPPVSRVPEIGMHGLKGGPALSPLFNIV